MLGKISKLLHIFSGLIILGITFLGASTVSAKPLDNFGALRAGSLSEEYTSLFSQNNITGWNPNECSTRGGLRSDSCFKIDSSIGAQDFWYPEGCLNNGTCTAGIYAAGMSLVMTSTNPFLYGDTKTDDEFGGMQYIYAENYNYEYDGAYTKLTPNGGSSTQKYYWTVLPDQAYSNGFGDTYVATFENLSEPVYFIVFDVHACEHQSEDYCGKANSNPDSVEAGREFLGAFTKNGGGYTDVVNIAGRLTSLCRINGSGEVTASHSGSASNIATASGETSSQPSDTGSSNSSESSGSPSSSDNSGITAIAGGSSTSCTTYEGDYPEYYQGGQSWSGVPYDGGNIGDSGCGPSSMAMIATAVAGVDIFPNDVVDITGPHGNYVYTSGSGMTALDKVVGEKYGFEVIDVGYSSLSDAIQKMRQYLEDGYMLHFSGAGGAPFTGGGHYVGAFAINGDMVKVADSNLGNKDYNINDLVYAGLHGGSFSASRGNNSSRNTCDNDYCAEGNNGTSGNGDVLRAVEEIIELANKNGSTYTWGGGHTSDSSVFDSMLNGAPVNVDCTGFASLVMYKTYGQMTSFTSYSIFDDPLYEEVPRSEVSPGDIFAYNEPSGHGGIVIEASNGVVTKIAETGGSEGRSGGNSNIGYSGADSFSVTNMNGSSGHFFRWKGGR